MADRLNSYKNRGKTDEYRKRMKNEAVELRKAKKDEQLTKRRNLHENEDGDDDIEASAVLQSGGIDVPNAQPNAPDITADIHNITQALYGTDQELILQATRASRKLLSREKNPPIELFIKADLVPRFVSLLSSESAVVQFEAAWVLTNIASGTEAQTCVAVNAGVCQCFLKLLREAAPNIVEQVLWGLSNIAGTGARYRDLLLEMEILPVLVNLVQCTTSRTLLATASWCLSNLCRKMDSAPDFQTLLPAIPILKKLLEHDSVPVVSDACWALSYFTDGPNERIEVVSQAGVIPLVVGLLGNCTEKTILIPALRVIGNIVTGDDAQTQKVIDLGALSALKTLLNETAFVAAKKEVVWALSNVLAGNVKQIEAVLNEDLLGPLVQLLSQGDYKCRVETTWAICNLTCGGSPQHIELLIRSGALGPLSVMLECEDSRLIKVILDAFGNILRGAQDLGILPSVLSTLEEVGFVSRVEMLQMHETEAVYRRAAAIFSAYWSDNEAEASLATSEEQQSPKPVFDSLTTFSKFVF